MRHLTNGISTSFEAEKIEAVLTKKRANHYVNNSVSRIIGWLIVMMFLSYDIFWQEISRGFGMDFAIVWWGECVLMACLFAVVIKEMYEYCSVVVFPSFVDVTETEQVLLGVGKNEAGFRQSPKKPTADKEQPKIKFSPSMYQPSGVPSGSMCNSFKRVAGLINGSPNTLMDESLNSSSFTTSPTPVYTKNFNTSFGTLFGSSFDENVQLRKRLSPPSRRITTSRDINCTSSLKELDTFLIEEAAKDRTEQLAQQNDMNTSLGYSFWTINRTVSDYVPILKKFQYQVAPRSSQISQNSSNTDDHPSKYTADEVWSRAGFSQVTVDVWIENLRYWLGQTIVQKLAKEIHKINEELKNVGSEDRAIGEASVSTLKNLAFVKSSLLPTLNNIIPYLEISSHQGYLVQRIKALGGDGCVADFNWDGGAPFNGQKWEDYLPTDSAIVMHMFCTYLDARLPSNPKYPDGKAFSSQHFMKAPEKPNFTQKQDYLMLYQTQVNPPHYKLIIGDEIHDLPKGRNNMFQAILLLLLHIRDKKNGMLGHVSFGPSGVNAMWVLSQKYR